MEFNNTVAFCKGWYKSRGDVDTMWMDMSHCIQVDGWMCYSKGDVARWCMSRMDEFAEEFPDEAWRVSFNHFFGEMERNKQIWNMSHTKDQKDIDSANLIIWTFRNFVKWEIDKEMFNKGVIPNEKVLPFSDTVDAEKFKTVFPDYKEQTFDKWSLTYEEREAKLKK